MSTPAAKEMAMTLPMIESHPQQGVLRKAVVGFEVAQQQQTARQQALGKASTTSGPAEEEEQLGKKAPLKLDDLKGINTTLRSINTAITNFKSDFLKLAGVVDSIEKKVEVLHKDHQDYKKKGISFKLEAPQKKKVKKEDSLSDEEEGLEEEPLPRKRAVPVVKKEEEKKKVVKKEELKKKDEKKVKEEKEGKKVKSMMKDDEEDETVVDVDKEWVVNNIIDSKLDKNGRPCSWMVDWGEGQECTWESVECFVNEELVNEKLVVYMRENHPGLQLRVKKVGQKGKQKLCYVFDDEKSGLPLWQSSLEEEPKKEEKPKKEEEPNTEEKPKKEEEPKKEEKPKKEEEPKKEEKPKKEEEPNKEKEPKKVEEEEEDVVIGDEKSEEEVALTLVQLPTITATTTNDQDSSTNITQ